MQNIYFIIEYIENQLDIKNFTTPLSSKLDVIYILIDPFSYVASDVYFQYLKVNTDVGLVGESIKSIVARQVETIKVTNKIRDESNPFLLDFYITMKNKSMIIERNYYKLMTLIAELGSFFTICVNVFTLVLIPVKEKMISCEIMSELYDFHIDNSQKKINKDVINKIILANNKTTLSNKNSNDSSRKLESFSNIDVKNTNILDLIYRYNKLRKALEVTDKNLNKANMKDQGVELINKSLKDEQVIENSDLNAINNINLVIEIDPNNKIEELTNNKNSPQLNVSDKNFSELIDIDKTKTATKDLDNIVEKINKLSESIYKKKTDFSRIKYNNWQLILSSFCCKIIKPKKVQTLDEFYNKCFDEMKQYLDINILIRKLKEIESLKLLICNSHQISCFNFFVKPEIDENNYYRYSSKIQKFTQNSSDQEKIKEIISYFLDKRDGKASVLDSKLLEMLDEELVELIDATIELSKKNLS